MSTAKTARRVPVVVQVVASYVSDAPDVDEVAGFDLYADPERDRLGVTNGFASWEVPLSKVRELMALRPDTYGSTDATLDLIAGRPDKEHKSTSVNLYRAPAKDRLGVIVTEDDGRKTRASIGTLVVRELLASI